MVNTDSIVSNIVGDVADHDEGVDPENVIRSKVEQIANEYHLPESELRRSVRNSLEREPKITLAESSEFAKTPVVEIQDDEQWCDVEIKVVDLWDSDSDAIAQTGLVGDESGTIKFTSFATSDLPKLQEGETYQLENVVGNLYQGDISINLNRNTEITAVDQEIEVGDNAVTIEGRIVALQSGSGLIERCSEEEDCQKALNRNGRCQTHGDVADPDDDLRIKAIIDDGETPENVVIHRDITERITGIELDEAIAKAKDQMDRDVIARDMNEKLIGQSITVTGPVMYGSVQAESVDMETDTPTVDELLTSARSLSGSEPSKSNGETA